MATTPQPTGIKNADELLTLAHAFGLAVTVETTDRDTLTSYVVRIAIPVPAAYAGTELGRAIAGDTLTLVWTKAKKKGARGCLIDATAGSAVHSRKVRTLAAVTAAVDTLGRSSTKYARDAAPLPEDVVEAPHALYIDGELRKEGVPADRVRTIVKNRRFRGWTCHQDADKAIVCESRRYVPVQPAPAEDPYNALYASLLSAADMSNAIYDVTVTKGDAVSDCPAQEGKRLAPAVEIVHTFRRRTETTETPAPAADERKHVRTVNGGPAEVIPTREALAEMNAAQMEPEVKRTVKRMSASRSTAHIVYRDGRTVYLRPATPGDVFPTPAERPTDAELTGDITAELSAYYAETFQAIADGSALPVRADMIRPGMDVIHAHLGETRTIATVTAYAGPGAPWVRPTWTFRNHDESTTGSTFPPDMHLMVTRTSLDAVFGPAPVEDTAPAAPVEAAPLFAALAAHEATMFCTSPRDLDDLARHLHAVGKAAPTAHHREILEAQADVIEGAREALRTAGNLRARTAAHDQARAAVDRARAVILTVAPHAHRMHGTDVPSTAEEIRAAAVAYNAVGSTAEELSALETGTPKVRVHCTSDSGTGWNVTATIAAGIDTPHGFIPAHPAIVEKFRKRDGREGAAANARKAYGAMFNVAVPVEYARSPRG